MAFLKPDSLHTDWTTRPLWWDEAPLEPSTADLPARADVAVVGSGYCGLSAARTLAEAGRNVVVLDAGDPGWGASTRNHGMVAGGLRIPVDIDARVGPDRGARIRASGKQSFLDFKNLIADRNLDVDLAWGGRFTGAHSPDAFERQRARGAYLRRTFGYDARALPQDEQRSEIGSDYYYGGLLVAESAGLHPGKLYRAFRRLAEQARAVIVGQAEVRAVDGKPGAFSVRTSKGDVAADQVVLATNAYTGACNGGVSPFVHRRVVPVTAYMIATEELPAGLADTLLPTNRMCGDTKRSLYAFRLSPDRKRLVFAGRAKFRDISERDATPILHGFMCQVFPELAGTRVTHAWKGMVCFTFDNLPHVGTVDGVHYAAGCQGNGVVMMSYLGQQVARKILTGSAEECGFDGLSFPTRPLYYGKPWFLPAVGAYYKARDAVDRYHAVRSKLAAGPGGSKP